MLMDCDTAWVGYAPLPRGEPVAWKIVDNCRPPENVFAGIFQAAGLREPNWVEVSIPKDDGHRNSDWNNFNGGLYILDGRFVAELSPVWRAWATWRLDRLDLFGEFARDLLAGSSDLSDDAGVPARSVRHRPASPRRSGRVATGSIAFPRIGKRPLVTTDQVSFALALRELGVLGRQLPIEWNYPTYSPVLPDVTPQILHYSRQVEPPFKLCKPGIPSPDRAIDALNGRIEAFFATHSTRWAAEPVKASWKRQVLDFFRGGSLTSIQ